ncbi:MAG: glycerophosphodiester phosphodiesterase [Lachnospiraceae bacterium]|nr:glycerophosphodiester phosphodiesterase [Lachnospiraceae bacterium]
MLFLFCVSIVALLFFGMLYAIAPNHSRDYSDFKGRMYAHRGLHQPGVPENSMAAFKLAVEGGYGVELDVQFTKDHHIVVFHDANLKRMCGVNKRVRDCTYEELQGYRLQDTDQTIPLFTDVLEVLGETTLICEIKNHNGNRNNRLCRETYEALCRYKGKYCIESFSPFLVGWFRNNHPEVIRGQLSCAMKDEGGLGYVARLALSQLFINCISRPDFIAYRHQDYRQPGFYICSKLYHPLLVAWTARGNEEQNEAWKRFDAVIFELYANPHPVE